MRSWRPVQSFWGYPKGLKHNLEHNCCSTGDESNSLSCTCVCVLACVSVFSARPQQCRAVWPWARPWQACGSRQCQEGHWARQPACLPACLIFYVHPQIFYIPHLIFCIPSLIFYEPPKYSTYPYRTSQERGVQLHNSASPWARTVPIRCLCRILEGVCRIVDGLHKISDGVTIGVRRIFWTE